MDELPGARFPPVRTAPPARVPQTLRVAGEAAFLAKRGVSCRTLHFSVCHGGFRFWAEGVSCF